MARVALGRIMSAKYYYTVKRKRLGAVTIDELKSLAAREELKRSDLIWTEGMAVWQRACLTPGLFDGLPPDLEVVDQTGAPPPLPTEVPAVVSSSQAKPVSPGLIVGLIVLAAVVIMIIIHQTQRATQDQIFDGVMQDAQNAEQTGDPRYISPR